jgi:DNA adenine methylase
MKNPKAYQNYFGGKGGSGTYQTLINHIPPHDVFASLYLGNCGVTRNIRPARFALLNDIDVEVFQAWEGKITGFEKWELHNIEAEWWLGFFANQKCPFGSYPEDVFIFLDPPYLLDSRKDNRPVYRHEMTKDQHIQLLKCITSPKMKQYKIMLCCYPNELYALWLDYAPNWHYVDYLSTTRNGLANERIYMNYQLNGQLHDTRYYGENFRQREQFRRICASLVKKIQKVPEGLRPSVINDIVTSLQKIDNGN